MILTLPFLGQRIFWLAEQLGSRKP